MLSSTFTPATSNADDQTFDQIKAADDAVFGSGSDEPTFVVLDGVVYRRELSTGDLPTVVQPGDPEASQHFRRLHGTLVITGTS